MNNEIKEILYLEKYIDKYKSDEKSIINGNRLTTPAMLDYLEVKSLLDYITNLQQENEGLNQDLSYYQRYGADMLNKNNILEERIEKAVEYIKEHEYDIRNNFECYVKGNELLNVLNGRSDE